ncbi:hypothetical protein B484DRAFT_411728 [Ochromonadaceae sp. CCMP2298]|nr:hypothetical protein B484DRAFT_411728 [Ochromonadaceae sp. CCMP2298]
MSRTDCALATEALQHFLQFSVGRRWQARRLMVLRRKQKRIEVVNRAANIRRDRASVLLKIDARHMPAEARALDG